MLDRLIEEHQDWGTLRYEYDSVGQLKHCRLPDGSKLDYRHQPGGQLSSIDLNGSRLTLPRYDPNKIPTSWSPRNFNRAWSRTELQTSTSV
ncbi:MULTISPECIES: hypothetical protein [unclassified Pseudomonas]|uniref:hypothetical protein n=1 Tax=unclassified Pseudomonas TaxID=196821 RepID=UPI001A9F0DC7